MDLSALTDSELLALRVTTLTSVKTEHINQHARKILINALYGITGNRYFRYYDIRNAKAVTFGGQLATRWAERKINEYLNGLFKTDTDYVIYGDTDSVYITLKELTDKLPHKTEDELVDAIDKFCNTRLQPVINEGYEELEKYTNCYEQRMKMDREVIATCGFWTAMKKRYALFVKDNEGLRQDKLKIMGIETQSSKTPQAVSDALKHCIKLILTSTESEMQIYILEFEKEFKAIDYLKLASPITVNNIAKYSDENHDPIKGCTGNVKAVLTHNKLARMHNFDVIPEGEKVAILPLVMPNKYNAPTIGFLSGTELPIEIREYVIASIDYNMLWDKMFQTPLDTICSAINFKSQDNFDLDEFM